MEHDYIGWEAFEYEPRNHTTDWYWAVGIISVSLAIVALFFGNVIFAILILLSAFTLCLFAAQDPQTINLEINEKGVIIEKRLYPYDTLQSFWIDEIPFPKILLKSKKMFMPYIVMPLHDDLDRDEVRELLLRRIKEVEHSESIFHKIMEYLGF